MLKMTWERFHYVCRRAANSARDDEPLTKTIKRIEQEPGTRLYGAKQRKQTVSCEILHGICALSDHERARRLLEFYGRLDLAGQLEEPLRFRRVMLYLGYVTLVFSVVTSLYQTKITPNFINAYRNLDIPVPADLIWFMDYGWHLSMVILVILAAGLLIGHQLRQLYRYRQDTQQSLFFRYLTLPGIKRPYLNILGAIHYPMRGAPALPDLPEGAVTAHLQNLEGSNMDLCREIQELVRREGMILTARCERQMRIISTVIALVIIASIFLFLKSAYLPLFILGDISQ